MPNPNYIKILAAIVAIDAANEIILEAIAKLDKAIEAYHV